MFCTYCKITRNNGPTGQLARKNPATRKFRESCPIQLKMLLQGWLQQRLPSPPAQWLVVLLERSDSLCELYGGTLVFLTYTYTLCLCKKYKAKENDSAPCFGTVDKEERGREKGRAEEEEGGKKQRNEKETSQATNQAWHLEEYPKIL